MNAFAAVTLKWDRKNSGSWISSPTALLAIVLMQSLFSQISRFCQKPSMWLSNENSLDMASCWGSWIASSYFICSMPCLFMKLSSNSSLHCLNTSVSKPCKDSSACYSINRWSKHLLMSLSILYAWYLSILNSILSSLPLSSLSRAPTSLDS